MLNCRRTRSTHARHPPRHPPCAQAFANVIWACGKAGFGDAALLDECLERLLAAAARAKPQELANAIYGAASLAAADAYRAPPLVAAALAKAFIAARRGATQQELSNALWGAATLGLPLPKAGVVALAEELAAHGGSLQPQAVANSLWAAAALGASLPRGLLQVSVVAEAVAPCVYQTWQRRRGVLDSPGNLSSESEADGSDAMA